MFYFWLFKTGDSPEPLGPYTLNINCDGPGNAQFTTHDPAYVNTVEYTAGSVPFGDMKWEGSFDDSVGCKLTGLYGNSFKIVK